MSDEQKAQEGQKPDAPGGIPAEGHAQAATATEESELRPAGTVQNDIFVPTTAVVAEPPPEVRPDQLQSAEETPQPETSVRPPSGGLATERSATSLEPAQFNGPNDAKSDEGAVPSQPAHFDRPIDTTPEPAITPPAPRSSGADLDPTAEFEAALNAFEGGTTGTSYDETFRPLTRGELLTARVIQVDKDKVFVDLGTKSEGVVPLDELSSTPFENATDVVKVGDQIKVVVLNPQGREGNPIVSRKRAEFESAWDRIIEEFEQKKTVTALVSERVKGGLVVDLGVRGFVPATHVGNGQIRNLDKFVGQSLPFKIIEVDRDRRKVVLSNRLAEEEGREQRKQDVFDRVKPGDILDGTIRRIVDYGAFVNLGGVDGLLHVSEMSWSRVENPRDILREGDDIKVMVLRLDPNTGRISLGRRQVLPDPWSGIRENYSIGQRLTLPISRVVPSGAFVNLPEGGEGFIPISEMAHRRINKPFEVVNAGQNVDVQIIDLRPDERRMVLSMRALLPYEERPQQQQQQQQRQQRDDYRPRGERSRDRGRGDRGDRNEQRSHQSAPSGNLTIGERLSALKGLGNFDQDEETPEEAPKAKKQPAETAKTSTESAPAEVVPTEAPASQEPPMETAPTEATSTETPASKTPSEEIASDTPPANEEAGEGIPKQ